MAENKQSQLNGSYYGPSIPPNNNRRRRNCCCRIFNIFWKILLSIITLIVLLFIISLIIVQPRPFKFSVTQANLTQFNYTSTNTLLHYKLVLNFTSHNPNKKLAIYYDKVEGNVFYQGSRFSTIDVITWLNSFRQDSNHTDRMSGVFKGTKVLVLDQSQRSKFDQDKRDGDFDIYVKLHFDIRFGLDGFIFNNIKFINSKATVKCGIKVPLSGYNGKVMGARFEPKKCNVNVKWV